MGSKSSFKKVTTVKFLGLKLFEIHTDGVDRILDVDDADLLDEMYLSDLRDLYDEE